MSESFEVELPAGGRIFLRSSEEVEIFTSSRDRYKRDYSLNKQNDLILLGVILSHQITIFRAQQDVNGMEPILDDERRPTGEYRMKEAKAQNISAASNRITAASKEIREIEKALGIDKKSREAGGAFSIEQYIKTLKKASREFGLHIARRVLMHEWLANELRWRIRLLRNGDDEDRAYHGITQESIIDFAERGLAKIEEADKKHANEKGKLTVGKL